MITAFQPLGFQNNALQISISTGGAFQKCAFQSKAFQAEVCGVIPPTPSPDINFAEVGIGEIGGTKIPNALQYPGLATGVSPDFPGSKNPLSYNTYFLEVPIKGQATKSIKKKVKIKGKSSRNIEITNLFVGNTQRHIQKEAFFGGNVYKILERITDLTGSSVREINRTESFSGNVERKVNFNYLFTGKTTNKRKINYMIYELLFEE